MSVPEGSLKAGTVVVDFELPETWPPPGRMCMYELKLADGLAVIEANPDSSIQAILVRDGETGLTVASHAKSPPVSAPDGDPIFVAMTWTDAEITAFQINTINMLTASNEALVFRATFSGDPPTDYSQRNEEKRRNRHSSMRGKNPIPGRKRGGREHMMGALSDEAVQLGDLLALIRSGKDAHVPGLASRLRTLTIGSPFGLLQYCAAYESLSLTLYVNHSPEKEPPPFGGIAYYGGVAAKPGKVRFNPVDLDVWLDLPAIQIQDRKFTHREVIKEIGNTVGSHRDPDIGRLVQALQYSRSQPGRYRDLQRYVVSVGEVLLSLCQFVLANEGGLQGR